MRLFVGFLQLCPDLVSWGSSGASTGRVSLGRNERGSEPRMKQGQGGGGTAWCGGREGGRGGSGGR